jgi:UDP-N-acetylmuramyl pentapeptide synthase
MSQSQPARQLLDEPSIENANAAACVAKTLGIETQIIASQVRKRKTVPDDARYRWRYPRSGIGYKGL